MLINSIKLKDFRSFNGEHSFDFSTKPAGLYNLSGENGSGKSTLFEGLHWLLFGTTSRGLKARDIHSWNVPGSTWGELSITIDQNYTIERQWSPNKLRLNGRDVEQAELAAILPMTSDMFQTAIYMSQFNDMFFDLKPTARLDLISSILQLDYWIDCSAKAGKEKNAVVAEQIQQQKKLEFLNGKMDQLINNAENYETKAGSFDREKDQKIATLTATLNEYTTSIKNLLIDKNKENNTTELQKEFKKLDIKLNKLNRECLELEEECSKYSASIAEANSDLQKLRVEAAPHTKALQKFTNLQSECVACNQPISKSYKTAQIEETTKHLKQIDQQIDTVLAEIKTLSNRQEKIKRTLNEKNGEFESVKNSQLSITAKLNKLEQEQNLIQAKIKNTEALAETQRKLILEWETKTNPYEQELESCVNQLETLDCDKTRLEGTISDLTNTIAGIEYWVKTFKEIRLYVAEEILTNLEIRVNNYMNDLGLQGWTIKFDVEKENRSGGISKGFHILIKSPLSDDNVLWESWSGGEAQRLRLAGTLGLSDLILQSMGLQSNLLILDEPTKHLNDDGINNLLELLYAKANQDNKNIWMIDHHVMDFGGFAEVVQVVKDTHGSHLLFT
jgi:DNA repair exonuclease SbcCD ATPase subunit